MRFFSAGSIALVAGLMMVTPSVTAVPRQMQLEDVEAMDVNTLLSELENDPAMGDQLFGFGGRKQSLISKLAGGGIKGVIADKFARRYLQSYGKKLGVDLSAVMDSILRPEGPDIATAYSHLSKSPSLSKITSLIDRFGGIQTILGILERFGGLKSLSGKSGAKVAPKPGRSKHKKSKSSARGFKGSKAARYE